jgi:hypothetical protein
MISLIRALTAILAFGLGIGVVSLFPPLPNLRPARDVPDIFEDVTFSEILNDRYRYDGHRIRFTARKDTKGLVGLELFDPEGGTRVIVGVCPGDENCGWIADRHPELFREDREVIVTGVYLPKPSTCGIAPHGMIVIYNVVPADADKQRRKAWKLHKNKGNVEAE